MTRLLVVRLGSLGDLIHTLPAVSALHRRFPALEIDWVVDAVHRPLLDLVPVVSSVLPFDGRRLAGWRQARRTLRARGYDVALDLQGLVKSAVLARLSGARRVIGFDRRAAREGAAAAFYTERVAAGESGHVIRKNLRLAAALGADEAAPLEFPLRPVASSPALDAVRSMSPAPFVLINCGAAWPNKRWPPDRFGRLAAWIRERHRFTSVVLWGPGEADLAAAVAAASDGAAVQAPETGLADVIALSRSARLMISGDTGPTHIAAAVGTPVVALFGPTSPQRNGPWSASDVTLSRYDECHCHYQRECRRPAGAWCLGTIDEQAVRAAVDRRLEAAAAAP